ncbi:hypothetical protein, partial [Chryseobacterium contaminans]|uniref:hypothetical protein n=1 Tax=Chryseobacterium contaminans TaxID=1423959 RepID=UPI001114D910
MVLLPHAHPALRSLQLRSSKTKRGIYKVYHYAYELNRLKSGVYREPYTTLPDKSFFNEELNYDLNGNITRLWRTGKNDSNTALLVDNLT